MKRSILPLFLLFALVGAAAVPAAYRAGFSLKQRTLHPKPRALRHLEARLSHEGAAALPPDTLARLARLLRNLRDTPEAHAKADRLLRQADARGSKDAAYQIGVNPFMRGMATRDAAAHAAGRQALRRSMQRGSGAAFSMLIVPYAGVQTPGELPSHPDSLVLLAREARRYTVSALYINGVVTGTLGEIAREADAGRADAQRMRADLKARGLWEIEG